jgi:hypothetical protein
MIGLPVETRVWLASERFEAKDDFCRTLREFRRACSFIPILRWIVSLGRARSGQHEAHSSAQRPSSRLCVQSVDPNQGR